MNDAGTLWAGLHVGLVLEWVPIHLWVLLSASDKTMIHQQTLRPLCAGEPYVPTPQLTFRSDVVAVASRRSNAGTSVTERRTRQLDRNCRVSHLTAGVRFPNERKEWHRDRQDDDRIGRSSGRRSHINDGDIRPTRLRPTRSTPMRMG
jgi:hypothetical protein